MILSAFIIFVIALIMPVQTSLNARLSAGVKSSFIAALVSFVVGTAALVLTLLLLGNSLWLPHGIFHTLPWWAWMGGCAGAIGIIVNILLFPKLGSIQTVLLVMFGQVSAGLLTDSFGLFGAAPKPITALRAIGTVVVLLGICLVVIAPKQKANNATQKMLPYQLLGFMGGLSFGFQPSLNGRLGEALGSPLMASTVSFATGALLLVVLVLLIGQHRQQLCQLRSSEAPWWCWLGGLIGVATVWSGAALVGNVGAALLNVLSIFGMLLSSSLIDHLGLFGAMKRHIKWQHIIGLAFVFVGMLII